MGSEMCIRDRFSDLADEGGDKVVFVETLHQMVVCHGIYKKLSEMTALRFLPNTPKQIEKILQVTDNDTLMSLRKLCIDDLLAEKGACKKALEWAAKQDGVAVSLSGEDIASMCTSVEETIEYVRSNYDTRTQAVKDILAKHHEVLSDYVSALPPLAEDSGHAEFLAHINSTDFAKNIEKSSRELQKIKGIMTRLVVDGSAEKIDLSQKLLFQARGHVASFAALTLLSNPRLPARGKMGDHLRKQLDSTNALIESRGGLYGEVVPQWLKNRMYVALGIKESG